MPSTIAESLIPEKSNKQSIMPNDQKRPIPEVHEFNATSATAEEVIHALITTGGCIVRGLVDKDRLNSIEMDTRCYLEEQGGWKGDFFPSETRRVCGLAGKSKHFMNIIPGNELYQAVCNAMLSSQMGCWVGSEWKTSVSKPQINNTIIFSIHPGARDQELHRDDIIHHTPRASMQASDYKIGQDTGIGLFVAGKKTTRANGATRFIPGSHLWDVRVPPADVMAVYAELNPGDAFFLLASAYHGGSANTTTDEERLVYSCFMTKGYLRQEENQYIANSWDVLSKKYADDEEMLKMLGYDLSLPFLGWVDVKHPLEYLTGNAVSGDMF